MTSGVEIRILWFDQDIVEVRITAANARFSASADLYCTPGFAKELSEAIQGFPRTTSDTRRAGLGGDDSDPNCGSASFEFTCRDKMGHCDLKVSLREDDRERSPGSAAFTIPVEPGPIDEFARQLQAMPIEVGAGATLLGAA